MAGIPHLQIGGIWIDCTVREVHSLRATATQHPVEAGAPITDHVRPQPDSLQIEAIVTNTPLEQPGSHAPDAMFQVGQMELQTRVGASRQVRLEIEGEPVYGWMQYGSFAAGLYASVRNSPLVPRRQLTGVQAQNYNAEQRFGIQGFGGLGNSLDAWDRVKSVQNDLRWLIAHGDPVTVVTGIQTYTPCVMVDLQIQRDSKTGGALMFSATLQVIRVVNTQTGKPIPQDVRATPAQAKGNQNVVPTKPGEIPPSVPEAADSMLKQFTNRPPEPGQ